jgi:Ca2+-binding RTX toxin-like protein
VNGTDNNDYLLGTAAAESIAGKGGDDTLEGGPGDDTLSGGDGEDWVSYQHAAVGVVVSLLSSTQAGAEGTDTLIRVENLMGSEFDDTLIGWDASNRLAGLGGHNVLDGSGANDWATYALASSAVNASLVLAGGYQNVVGTQFDWYISIENLEGTAFNDTLRGDGDNNELSGGGGVDTLIGGPGGDTLDGGAGADSMVGGPGSDEYHVDDAHDIVVEQAVGGLEYFGGDRIYAAIDFALPVNVENLRFLDGYGDLDGEGNSGDNDLRGNDGLNALRGKGGDDTLHGSFLVPSDGIDTLIGGPGNDLYPLYTGVDVIREAVDGGNDTVETLVSMTAPRNVEWVLVMAGADGVVIRGNDQGNGLSAGAFLGYGEYGPYDTTLRGGGGDDTLVGGLGSTVLWGGEGDDVLNWAGGSSVLLHGGPGNDTIEGWFVYFDVAPGAENADTLERWRQIRLDDDIFKVFSAGQQGVEDSNVVIGAGHTALDADDYLLVDTSDAGLWSVWYDADGNGTDFAPEVFVYGYYHEDPDDFYHQPMGHDAFRVVG